MVSLESAGCAEGTTIVVRDLFYNVPARQAFLKKPAYEYGAVNEVVTRLALGNPKVAFRLIHNGKTIFSTYGDGNLRHAAMAVYDRETANGMLEIDEAEGGYNLSSVSSRFCQWMRSACWFLYRPKCYFYKLRSALRLRLLSSHHPPFLLPVTT